MNYSLEYTDFAEENLREIGLHIAQDNIDIAIKYVEKIRNAADKLKMFPDLGSPARYSPARKRGIRVLIIDNYLLQYISDQQLKKISIIKISYGTQSNKKLFQLK